MNVRIPAFQEVVTNRGDGLRPDGRTVAQHIDQAIDQFVQERKGTVVWIWDAINFVSQELSFLPATEQAAVAERLLQETDRRTNWGPDQQDHRGRSSAYASRRQEAVQQALQAFVREAHQQELGVRDLARALELQLAQPEGVKLEDAMLNLGTHLVTFIEVPSIAAHVPREGVKEPLGWVARDGGELAFTGFVPTKNGYVQIHTRIEAEQESGGPLTSRERNAIQELGSTIGRAFGGELVPTKFLGTIGSEAEQQGVIARSFDQRQALANGIYVRTPLGEGPIHHTFIDRRPVASSFQLGPAHFCIAHGTAACPYENELPSGASFHVLTHDQSSALQVQIPLARGETAYITLPNQPSIEAAQSQLQSVLALAQKVFW